MKKLIFILFITIITYAQVITTIPSFPTESDSIKIIFNAQEAERDELVGYNGDVYTHTGVKTNLGDWQYVIGDWGNNSNQPQLTRIGTDLYELVIGFPREFYNVTNPGETIEQLNFVFRSADAGSQTEDIFVPLFESGPNIKIDQPTDEVTFAEVGEVIEIIAQSTDATSLFLTIDGDEVGNTNEDSLNYNLNVDQEKRYEVVATASEGGGAEVSDTIYIVSRGDLAIEDLPGGIEYGINYTSTTSATLVLHAPHKDFVYLIGDFNNWEESPSSLMKLTSDSTAWWIEINGLTPGQKYPYQYYVNGNLKIADPYTTLVLDPSNDPFISNDTYPNLLPYPSGKTTGLVSVLQPGESEYEWTHTSFNKPEKTNLVVYELLIRDFLADHDYKTLIDTLDYLQNLGVTAIELMPINEFEGNESWGYNPSFYFAPDKYYGPEEDLKAFIDSCHGRGMAVIIDMVLNHSYGQSPMVQLYFDYYADDEIICLPESPWYNVKSPNTASFKWGADFNHESQHTKDFIDRVNTYWIEEFKVDGFRFDFTKGFTNTVGDGWAYDASRIAILKRMANVIWQSDPLTYIILEHFTENAEEKELVNYGMMIWGNFNYNYNEATMGYHDDGKSNFSDISYKTKGWTVPHLVGFMESHDEERIMFKNLEYGNSSGSYNVKELFTALQRVKMAAAFFFTVPGPKMIWQFGELGYDISIDDPCRVCNKPILWNYIGNVYRYKLYQTFSALINLKNNYEVFSTTDFIIGAANPVKRIRLNHESMNVNILGNFDVVQRTTSAVFQNTGMWYDYFSGDSLEVNDTGMDITLEPGEFHIYTTEKLPTPEGDILSDVNEFTDELPLEYSLSQNYPNPFNPTTTINFRILQSGFVTLKVYNILGQEVKSLISRDMSAGNFSVIWDGTNSFGENLSSGIYIYRVEAENFIQSKKMILLK